VPRALNFLIDFWPQAQVCILAPYWTSQAWFQTFIKFCDVVFWLLYEPMYLFQKAYNVACPNNIKNPVWSFAVGLKNIEVHNRYD
jgi:hypothetical protein